MRKILKMLFGRFMLFILLIAVQIALIVMWIYDIAAAHAALPLITALSLILTIVEINSEDDPSFKMGWIVALLGTQLFGCVMYILCAGKKVPKKLMMGTTRANGRMKPLLKQDSSVQEEMKQEDPASYKAFVHNLNISNFPIYKNTSAQYFKSGEDFFPVFLEEIKKAKHFIFIEYFIIENGRMWDTTLEILKQKAAEGVEVKVIYDDMGCIDMPWHYDRELNKMGIETYKFNQLRPALMIQMNNRDHRKIAVIDNQVAFTGGVNFADEYINEKKRFGYWRDSAIMIRGDAVWSMTVMFLGMYSFLRKDDDKIDYSRYHLENVTEKNSSGWFQPFSDTPTDDKLTGLETHINIVNSARNYVYIDTPYLILPENMRSALILAANNGVDVRILVPHIPDKQIAFGMTKSNYIPLLRAGVKIYEYTPGFNHTKNIVSDDRIALVGSVNTDYRSYYLHFENGVLFADNPEVIRMRDAFLAGLEQSQEVTLEQAQKVNPILRCIRALLNVFAPLF